MTVQQRTPDRGWKQLEYLFRSEHRQQILDTLPTDFTEERTISDQISASRPTVHRCLSTFVEFGWALRDGTRYRRTRAGAVVLKQVTTTLEYVNRAGAFAPLFEVAASLRISSPLAALSAATTQLSTPRAPMRAASAFNERVSNAEDTRMHAYLGTVTESLRESLITQTNTEEATVLIGERQTDPVAQRAATSPNTAVRVPEWNSQHGLEKKLILVVFDQTNSLVGILDDNNIVTACAWGDDSRLTHYSLCLLDSIPEPR